MIEVEIPNNIAEYKPKMIFGLTGKQVVWALLTGICIFLDFKFLKPYISDTGCIVVALIPAAIAACFGWGEKFTPGNIPFEKYLKSVLLQALLAPASRKAKTTKSMVVPCDKNYVPMEDSAFTPEILECINYVREKNGITPDEPSSKKGKRKPKPKYKKSKSAML